MLINLTLKETKITISSSILFKVIGVKKFGTKILLISLAQLINFLLSLQVRKSNKSLLYDQQFI